MRDSVPSGSYSSVCNVLRQWKSRSSLLIESTDSMIQLIGDVIYTECVQSVPFRGVWRHASSGKFWTSASLRLSLVPCLSNNYVINMCLLTTYIVRILSM